MSENLKLVKPTEQEPSRNPDGTFKKGVSGNPGGRPKSLTRAIQEKTEDFKNQLETMIQISRGQEVFGHKPELKDIVDAVKWLADRGYGRSIQMQYDLDEEEAKTIVGCDWSNYTPEELQKILDTIRDIEKENRERPLSQLLAAEYGK